MRPRVVLRAAFARLLVPAAAARAQTDFSGTLSAASPRFTWQGAGSGVPDETPGRRVRCSSEAFGCDTILLRVEAAGELAITLGSPEGQGFGGVPMICPDTPCLSFQDLDGYLYKSDAGGVPKGETMTDGDAQAGEPDCATSDAGESCKVAVEPGFHLLEVEFFFAYEAPCAGPVELLGAAAPAAPADPPSRPQHLAQPQQPSAQPPPAQSQQPQAGKPTARRRRAACTKKARKIRNKRERAGAPKRCKRIR